MRAIIESDDFRLSSEPINKKSETATSRRRKNKP